MMQAVEGKKIRFRKKHDSLNKPKEKDKNKQK